MNKRDGQMGFAVRRFLWLMLILLALGSLLWALVMFDDPGVFPIQSVLIRGNFPKNEQTVLRKVIFPTLQKSFFTVNLQTIQADLQELPWVATAEAKRVWPSKLVINISVEKPIALWNKNQFLNAYGEIFNEDLPAEQIKQLPIFSGDAQSAARMMSLYQQMSEMLEPLNLKIDKITLDSDELWYVQLNNKMNLALGHDHILTRLQHFVAVYPKIFGRTTRRAKEVDLQYESGMAVDWI